MVRWRIKKSMKKIVSIIIGLSLAFSFATHAHAGKSVEVYMAVIKQHQSTGAYNKVDFVLRQAIREYPDNSNFKLIKLENLIDLKLYGKAFDELNSMDLSDYESKLMEAKIYAQSSIKGNNKADFYKAHDIYQEIINEYPREKKGYEDFIDLLLHIPVGWSTPKNTYKSTFFDAENTYEPKRKYKKARPFMQYHGQAYRYIENPLFEVDVIVNKAYTRLRANTIKYDKKWLSKQYVELSKSILAMRPDNPSPLLDRALIYADRALDLDRSSIEAANLRNTFRYHVR
jgi:tetratricopeptide (TPR) repeat protein